MFTFQLQIYQPSAYLIMALILASTKLTLTAQELVTVFSELNRFHQLPRTAPDFLDRCTAILVTLNGILNPREFEAVITVNDTIVMVMLGL